MGNYFGLLQQEAIEEYLFDDVNENRKRFLFTKIISPAIKKIASYYAYQVYNLDDIEKIKDEFYSHAVEMLLKFYNPSKGSAYSYISNVIKNYRNDMIIKYAKTTTPDFLNYLKDNSEKIDHNSAEVEMVRSEFYDHLISWSEGLDFDKPDDKKMLEAVIILLKDNDRVNIENKKKVVYMIHEITGIELKKIATFLLKIKRHYLIMKKKYYNEDD